MCADNPALSAWTAAIQESAPAQHPLPLTPQPALLLPAALLLLQVGPKLAPPNPTAASVNAGLTTLSVTLGVLPDAPRQTTVAYTITQFKVGLLHFGSGRVWPQACLASGIFGFRSLTGCCGVAWVGGSEGVGGRAGGCLGWEAV